MDKVSPVFTATEAWEHGGVYEPNLIYHDGKWKMWYVAGSNHEDYLAGRSSRIYTEMSSLEIEVPTNRLNDSVRLREFNARRLPSAQQMAR
jgi:hypothetical protein